MKDLWFDEETKELVYKDLRFMFKEDNSSCNECLISNMCNRLLWTKEYPSVFDICYEIDVSRKAIEISEQENYRDGNWVPTRSTIRKLIKFNKGKY